MNRHIFFDFSMIVFNKGYMRKNLKNQGAITRQKMIFWKTYFFIIFQILNINIYIRFHISITLRFSTILHQNYREYIRENRKRGITLLKNKNSKIWKITFQIITRGVTMQNFKVIVAIVTALGVRQENTHTNTHTNKQQSKHWRYIYHIST